PLLPWELETCWMLRFGESRQHHPSGCRSGRPTSFLGLHCQGPDTGDYPAAGDLGSGSFGSQRRNGVLNTPGLKGGEVIKTGHVVLRSIWIILSLAVLLCCQYVFDGKPNSDPEEVLIILMLILSIPASFVAGAIAVGGAFSFEGLMASP